MGNATPGSVLLAAALLATGAARAGTPTPTCGEADAPLACVGPGPPLRPVRDSYWMRWERATTDVMEGRGASALYRDPASHMDAWWQFAAFDRERPWLSDQDAAQARDLARIGAVMGLQRMLRETFERNDQLAVLYRIGSTVTGANLEIRTHRRGPGAPDGTERAGGGQANSQPSDSQPSDSQHSDSRHGDSRHGGGPQLSYNAHDADLRASDAAMDDDLLAAQAQRGARLRAGVAFQLVDDNPDPVTVDPTLAATAYADLRRIGPDALRLELSDTRPSPTTHKQDLKSGGSGTWSAAARQGLVPSLDLAASVQGREDQSWLPARASTGLVLRLPTERSWVLRADLSRRLPYENDATATFVDGEWRAMLTLRANLRWTIPQPWDGWTLGREPGSPGRDLLEVPGGPGPQ